MVRTVPHPAPIVEGIAVEEPVKPFDLVASLHEQVAELIEALVATRIQLEWPDQLTREEILLDLYDEELITKKIVIESGGIDRSEFFDKLFARRDARRVLQNADE